MSNKVLIVFFTAAFCLTACGPLTIGRPFKINPSVDLKIGHDQQKDVLRKLGQPFRRTLDAKGRQIFTYLWADGKGAGKKCTVAFNKNGIVSIVEVVP